MNQQLVFAGLAFEGGALAILLSGRTDLLSLLGFFGAHFTAGALLAPPLWVLLPAEIKSPKPLVIALLALTNGLVPFLAPLYVAAIHIGKRLRQFKKTAPVGTVADPVYDVYRKQDDGGATARGGRIRTKLAAEDASNDERLSSLLAIQDVPARVSADLLRELLADPLDDIRLLAYGMIDSKEKLISTKVLAERACIATAQSPEQMYGSHKRLAELYWELVFQRLVQGDMRRYASAQASHHADAALAIQQDDSGLWFLRGRIASELGQNDEALNAMQQAANIGYPRESIIPYLADFAFRKRQYQKVSLLYRELAHRPGTMRRAASYTFWTGRAT